MAHRGGDILVLGNHWGSRHAFQRDIESSELLSRGWVYQEVLLTPANLFCTPEQMWWSCFTSSLSQVFPKHILGWDWRGGISRVVDSIRDRKCNMMSPEKSKDWPNVWIDIVCNYSATSVTFNGDRVVAIAGLAQVFASRFPNLQRAVCHSGVWSTSVVPQLLWYDYFSKGYRFIPTHPIPSWSPLSCQPEGREALRYDTGHDGDIYVAEYVSMQTSGLDRFGRAKEQKDCVLHLRGVLFQIGLFTGDQDTYYYIEHAFNVTGYEDQDMSIF